MKYFSDIELGEKDRISEKIDEDIHKGIVAVYEKYAAKNAFSESAPIDCPDLPGICGFDKVKFLNLATGQIPNLDFKKYDDKYMILDFIQFCYAHIKKANRSIQIPYIHGLSGQETYALSYTFEESDREKENFKNDINTLFRRNGLIFELQDNGHIKRRVPSGIVPLVSKLYITNDDVLNTLVDEAFDNFLKVKIEDRRIALKKIWDAFDRMKTYHEDKDKKNSMEELIKGVSIDNHIMIEILTTEEKSLRNIGNGKRENGENTGFSIRHSEKNKHPITDNNQIDYLFYRMVSFMVLFLKYLEKDKKD